METGNGEHRWWPPYTLCYFYYGRLSWTESQVNGMRQGVGVVVVDDEHSTVMQENITKMDGSFSVATGYIFICCKTQSSCFYFSTSSIR